MEWLRRHLPGIHEVDSCVVVNLVAIFLESSRTLFCGELGEFATAEPGYHRAWEAIRFSGLLMGRATSSSTLSERRDWLNFQPQFLTVP